jgi:hypothetical protein
MYLPCNADVFCSDEFAGQATHIILKPKSDEVTHIVVKESVFGAAMRLVPISYLVASTLHTIQLSCTLAEMDAMPSFTKPSFMPNNVPIFLSNAAYEGAPVLAVPGSLHIHQQTEVVPEGEVAVGKDARGQTLDGAIGYVDGFVIEATSKRLSNLILREGVLWGRKHVSIPKEAVDFIDESAVYLKWDRARLAHLPAIDINGVGA